MCITAIIAVGMVVAGGVAAAASISAANANKAMAKYEAQVKEKQLFRDREMQRISSLQTENGRAAQFQQARSAALASIGASGLGEHISFFQSIDPEAQKAFLRDVGTIRLNMTATEASIADEVAVTEMRKDVAVHNAKMSKVGAIADFIQTAMQAGSFYAQMNRPAPAGGG